VNVIGALFVAGSAFEGSVLLASIAFGWKWGPYRPAPAAFIALLVVGTVATAATAGIGKAMMQTYVRPVAYVQASVPTGPTLVEPRAALALISGIAAAVLVWPFGILLGPAAFWFGVSAVRRIDGALGRLSGAGRAQTGAIIGALVSGMYLFWILADVAAIFAFGEPIPAAP
jgi:hypothetical protein